MESFFEIETHGRRRTKNSSPNPDQVTDKTLNLILYKIDESKAVKIFCCKCIFIQKHSEPRKSYFLFFSDWLACIGYGKGLVTITCENGQNLIDMVCLMPVVVTLSSSDKQTLDVPPQTHYNCNLLYFIAYDKIYKFLL